MGIGNRPIGTAILADEDVLVAVFDWPGQHVPERPLAARLGTSKREVNERLTRMRRLGLLKFEVADDGLLWRLSTTGLDVARRLHQRRWLRRSSAG